MAFLVPHADSLIGRFSGREHSAHMCWMPVLMLGWSVWIFATPMFASASFPYWLWPTVASYVLFLLLYWRVLYRPCHFVLGYALLIAALAFMLSPLNPGAQGYMIYCCAVLGLSCSARVAVGWMLGLLTLYCVYWEWLGFPRVYLFTTFVVGLMVGQICLQSIRKMQTDSALALSHDEVRRLAATAERERIGRDLHDLLGHTLSLVAIKADLAGRLIERDPARAHDEVAAVARVAREALAQVRSAVTGIRAAELAAELAAAHLLLETEGVLLDYVLPAQALPPELETVFALAVREAVTNIQRHAHAGHVRIELRREHADALLQIDDDGRGGEIVAGNGLNGMRERVRALGGELQWQSQRGQGTRLLLRLPLPPSPSPSPLG
jgi:two-component system sensor histidine kinase DesK